MLNFLKLLFKIEGTFDQLKVITIKILPQTRNHSEGKRQKRGKTACQVVD